MNRIVRKASTIAASTAMLGAMAAGTAYAGVDDAAVPDGFGGAAEQKSELIGGVRTVQSGSVAGVFSYDQTSVASTQAIAQALGKASRHLCGSSFPAAVLGSNERASLDEWEIAIRGDVEHEMVASLGSLAEKSSASITMGCSCAGNPADGQASVNADVAGVALKTILDEVHPCETANTITFTSADGYEVSLPLRYVMQRYCLLAFSLNGEPLADSIGSANQIWLGSTSAKYFAKDIVSIELESCETPALAPGGEAGDRQGANLPNVGVASGRVSR